MCPHIWLQDNQVIGSLSLSLILWTSQIF